MDVGYGHRRVSVTNFYALQAAITAISCLRERTKRAQPAASMLNMKLKSFLRSHKLHKGAGRRWSPLL